MTGHPRMKRCPRRAFIVLYKALRRRSSDNKRRNRTAPKEPAK